MIFLVVGTHGQQFDRLVKAVDALDVTEDRVIQFGHSTVRPVHGRAVQFLSFPETVELMRSARIVITHAGTGTVMLALSLGKRPIVAPRLKRYGEHVDDHQVDLVNMLAEEGRVVPYLDGDSLAARIETASGEGAVRKIEPDPRLVDFLIRTVSTSR